MNRKQIARQLVIEKAILDVLGEANGETRARAKDEYEPGDADSVANFGRVRMDKASQSWKVIDHSALAHWVDENAPDALVTVVQINSSWLNRVLKTGTVRIERTDTATGEITEIDVTPDGVGLITSNPRLVVTTTDEAEDAARVLLSDAMKAIES